MKKVGKYILYALTILVALDLIALGLGHFAKPPAPIAQSCNLSPDNILAEINTERSRLGAPLLTMDSRLVTTSTEKLNDMVTDQYYGHTSYDGSDAGDYMKLMVAQGFHGVYAGEDLDVNAFTDDQVWTAFKNSPPHYASLTNSRYKLAGVTTMCGLNYVIKRDTSPDIEGDTTGKTVNSITVVHLAE